MIKRLSDAVRDGDTVRAVIHASGASHDGRTNGIFAPSSEAQEKLVRDTYKSADLGYKYTSYVEAHGTGTAVGDPTEVRALVSAFKGRPADHPLYIGAVKSVLGHTEGAAGILGVIKTILVLESGVIPPQCEPRTTQPGNQLRGLECYISHIGDTVANNGSQVCICQFIRIWRQQRAYCSW